jgi:hypothetical protein
MSDSRRRPSFLTNRRGLIVTDAVVTGLCVLVGVANFALGGSVSILAGISALVVGACAAVTTCLLIASGGWRRDVTGPDRRRPDDSATRRGSSTHQKLRP